MFTDDLTLPNITIILVQPQMGENIGAVARILKNFNISDLRIVNPRDGWPSDRAQDLAVGAIDLINNTKIYNTITDTIADLEYVYAATARPRNMQKKYIFSHQLDNNICKYNKVGIMFGRENTGLSNQEVAYANEILTIGTNADFTALNISHAVGIICYELFQNLGTIANNIVNYDNATHDDLHHFYKNLFSMLEEKSFYHNGVKKEYMNIKIRNLFNRIDRLSKQDVQILQGIINVLSTK